ncbi:MAG: hypothetical protein R3B48_13885 [Kofleriaceae bacterium]
MSRQLLLRPFVVTLAAVLTGALALAGCGDEIGDSCKNAADCSPDGDRTCDTSSVGGYCTIDGCDFDTCPGEATCVRFYAGTFSTTCDPTAENACGSLDEVCTIEGRCAPRTNEARFCMRTCSSRSDCRDGYECRDLALMQEHGGEPVLAPGSTRSLPSFCAQAPAP